jgi:branched-chain amino acid transport system substrate-binding protein
VASVPAGAAEAPFEINVILPLSGGAAFLGKSEKETIALAEKAINQQGGVQGRPIRFALHDGQSNPQVAVQLANAIMGAHPSIIIGPTLVATCNAIAPLMRNGPVDYCFSPGIHPPAGSYVFSASVSTVDLERVLIRYFRLRGWTRLALITSTDATGQDAQHGIEAILSEPENANVKMVATAHFNPRDVSVAAQMATIKAAKPQALIAWSTGAAIATVFKGITQVGLDVPVATTDGNMTHAQMTQYASFLPKQLFIPAAVWVKHGAELKLDPRVEAAQKRFYAAFDKAGLSPDLPATLAWDTVMIVTDALRHTGLDADAARLRSYLAGLRGYGGINGVYDFTKTPQRGLGEENTLVTLWNAASRNWEPVSAPGGQPIHR